MELEVQKKWPPRVTLGRLLPHARGLGFKTRCGGFPSGAKKEWGLSPKAKVRVLHTAQLDVTGCCLLRFSSGFLIPLTRREVVVVLVAEDSSDGC
nr:hypothetical protein [Tanacetum cinerariifolium]